MFALQADGGCSLSSLQPVYDQAVVRREATYNAQIGGLACSVSRFSDDKAVM